MAALIIRTPGGEELVLMPRAEYDALIRQAERPAEPASVHLPEHVLQELAAGGSRLRILRSWRGLTQQALASEAGVSQSAIASAEGGGGYGGRIAVKAAQALGVPLEVLLGGD